MRKLLLLGLAWIAASANAADFDLVINNGRVIDPETGRNEVLNVGITDGRIVQITGNRITGEQKIDAAGLMVAPGFIDLHAHGQDVRSNHFQAADGVTTALEMEIGVSPVGPWLDSRSGKSPIHFGATSGHPAARLNLLSGTEIGNLIYADPQASASDYADATLDEKSISQLIAAIELGLQQGGLGIGSGITYTPAASHAEIFALFELASRYEVPVFVHMRQARYMGDDLLAPLQEVLANAAATAAPLHVVHINSSLDEDVRTAMQMIRGARANGMDVTTESYPYTAGSTRLESALFDNYQGDYGQLQWTATGERLSKETFEEYRKEGGWVIIHGRREDTNTWIVAQPDIMVASDGVPFVGDFSHPRSAGTFARVLGHYVRDEQALSLMTALRKMTLDPARRLESFAPGMRRKGRVQEGMDADLTLFDPDEILDQATYTVPARTSAGIVHVLVDGTAVVRDGELVRGVFPGKAIRSEF